jgi:hypothetical protein
MLAFLALLINACHNVIFVSYFRLQYCNEVASELKSRALQYCNEVASELKSRGIHSEVCDG